MNGHPSRKPILGIALGDVSGISPEIVVKMLGRREVYKICRPVVIGDLDVMAQIIKIAGLGLEVDAVDSVDESFSSTFGRIDVLDLKNVESTAVKIGRVSEAAGRAAMEFLRKGIGLALGGRVDALVLAPMNKEAMRMAGNTHADEAGLMGELANVASVDVVWKFRSLFKSTVVGHMAFREIPDRVTKSAILYAIRTLHRTIRLFGVDEPRIAVAALNPHGGEGGLFGTEESVEIGPAVASAKKLRIDARGPFPADTVFRRGLQGEFDGAVAMYHDQGNIALKTVGFGEIVNIYAGLPFVCTGPSHGTAFDIAGKGVADWRNLWEALRVAVVMESSRNYTMKGGTE